MGLGDFNTKQQDDDSHDDEPETAEAHVVAVVNIVATASAKEEVDSGDAESEAYEIAETESKNLAEYVEDKIGHIPGVQLQYVPNEQEAKDNTTVDRDG